MNANRKIKNAAHEGPAAGAEVGADDLIIRREDLVERLARRRAEAEQARHHEAEALIDDTDLAGAAEISRAATEEVTRLETAIALLDARIARADERRQADERADVIRREIKSYNAAAAALTGAIPDAVEHLVAGLMRLADDTAHVDFHVRRRTHGDEIIEAVRREFDARCAGRSTPFRETLAAAASRYVAKSEQLSRQLAALEEK